MLRPQMVRARNLERGTSCKPYWEVVFRPLLDGLSFKEKNCGFRFLRLRTQSFPNFWRELQDKREYMI